MSIGATGIAYVGYPVADLERSRQFYGETLGLKCTMDETGESGMTWIEYELGDATLAISNAWPPSGQSGPSAAIEVENLDAALDYLQGKGVPITMEKLESPVCHMFAISDPDGNVILIHKLKTPNV